MTQPIKITLAGYGPPSTSVCRGLKMSGGRLEATFPGNVQREYTAVIVPRADQINTWQKLYIDLSAITVLFENATFELVIESARDAGNTTATLLFDNIKLIHF